MTKKPGHIPDFPEDSERRKTPGKVPGGGHTPRKDAEDQRGTAAGEY